MSRMRRRAECCGLRCPNTACPRPCFAKEIELIRRLGVKFEFNKSVGTDISLNDLGQRVRRGVSLHRNLERSLGLPAGNRIEGRDAGAACSWKVSPRTSPCRSGKRVAIIGGGNAAIDSARTALRRGATVTVIYRRERKDMPAIQEEVEAAEAGRRPLCLSGDAPSHRGRERRRQGHRGGEDAPG